MVIYLSLIVEDKLSAAVANKILRQVGNYQVIKTLKWSKNKIAERINGINQACKGCPYFVLTDQDTAENCPPTKISKLHGNKHSDLLYRFAVMEIESWVMAHHSALAKFLSISKRRIPDRPDAILNPKQCLIQLARKSRSTQIKKDLVPDKNSTSLVGPGYNDRLIEFIGKHWNTKLASRRSPSLKRTFDRLREFSPTSAVC